ncbi:hypothetical protein C7401_12344 [Paraburkholderia unamae]|nr:hypothetical protein C7401_12344 [Paraburkholderia unamae]
MLRLRMIALAALMTPLLAQAYANDPAAYDQCALHALKNSRNSASVGVLRNACDKLYRGGAMTLPREKKYYTCLLHALPGVEDNGAVQQIMTICSRQRSM